AATARHQPDRARQEAGIDVRREPLADAAAPGGGETEGGGVGDGFGQEGWLVVHEVRVVTWVHANGKATPRAASDQSWKKAANPPSGSKRLLRNTRRVGPGMTFSRRECAGSPG